MRFQTLSYGNQLFLVDCFLFSSEKNEVIDRIHCAAAWIAPRTPGRMPLYSQQEEFIARVLLPSQFSKHAAPILLGDRSGPIEFDLAVEPAQKPKLLLPSQ